MPPGSAPPLDTLLTADPCPMLTTLPPLQMAISSASLTPRAPGEAALAVSTDAALAHPPRQGVLAAALMTSSPAAEPSTHYWAALSYVVPAERSGNGHGKAGTPECLDIPRQDRALLLGTGQSSEQLFTISHSLEGVSVLMTWFLSSFNPRTP